MTPALLTVLTLLALPAAPDVGPKEGALVIVGGGRIGREIVERFVGLAGGTDAEVVVIPTATESEVFDAKRAGESFTRAFGMKRVTVLHTRDRAEADTEAFVAPLKTARAVWFGGGRQWRLVDSYMGTRAQKEIEAVLTRGGVIGGSSAGATIQGSYLVRGAREGNTIMMAPGYEAGFGYLRGVAIDQHLLARKRENDMVAVIEAHPELLGLGIDEATAVVVRGNRFEIVGGSKVAIYDGKDHDGKRYYFLAAGDQFDLAERQRRPASPPSPMTPDPDQPRPIAAVDTVFLQEMTWLEVRDALRAGKTTAIVATGGIEQNGPYLALDKHNLVLRATTEAIARKLGNALIAPIIAFVPEGEIEPPSGHMKYPGTITLTEETYRRLLTDVCASLRVHGFTDIVLIGDSGGNQDGMKRVAEELNTRWADKKSRVHFIPEYYNYPAVETWLEGEGLKQTPEGLHDDFAITAMITTIDPKAVRAEQRVAAGKFRINGIDLAPLDKTIAWGRKIVDFRARAAVAAIHKSMERAP